METIDNNLVKVTNEDLVNGYFEVPENILCIKSECFVSAKKLKKLFIPDTVIRLEEHALAGAKIREINLPKCTLRNVRFYELTRLKVLNIDSSITNDELIGNDIVLSKYLDKINFIYDDKVQTVNLPPLCTISKKKDNFMLHRLPSREFASPIIVNRDEIKYIDKKFIRKYTDCNEHNVYNHYSDVFLDKFDISYNWAKAIDSVKRLNGEIFPEEYVMLSIPDNKKDISNYYIYKNKFEKINSKINIKCLIKIMYMLGFFSGKPEEHKESIKLLKLIEDKLDLINAITYIDFHKFGYSSLFKDFVISNYANLNKICKNEEFILKDMYPIFNQIVKKKLTNLNDIIKFTKENKVNVRTGNELLYKEFKKYEREYDLKDFEVMQTLYEQAKKMAEVESKKIIKTIDKHNGYTYEWLDATNIDNYFLGNKVGCCARINGFGEGILRESVLNSEVSNLVIKNPQCKIVGKCTAYYNRSKKYILFNTAEVLQSRLINTKQIYEALKRAVKDQVEVLNKDDILVKIIAIGLRNNDLISEIDVNPTFPLLENRSFDGMFDGVPNFYEGDANDPMYGQHTLWEANRQYKKDWLAKRGYK